MPSLPVTPGFSSVLSLTTSRVSAWSRAISSRTGAIALHGPHQGAQKSTSVTLLFLMTSASNDASSVVRVAPMSGVLPGLGRVRCGGEAGGSGGDERRDERGVTRRDVVLLEGSEEALGVKGGRAPGT